MRLRSVIGDKWVEIAAQIPGRTDSSCKNQYHKLAKKGRGPQQAAATTAALLVRWSDDAAAAGEDADGIFTYEACY